MTRLHCLRWMARGVVASLRRADAFDKAYREAYAAGLHWPAQYMARRAGA